MAVLAYAGADFGKVVTTLKNTWVDCSAIKGRLAALVGTTPTSGNVSVGSLYAADDAAGANPVLCLDFAGDPVKGRTLTAHTVVQPNPPGGTIFHTAIGVVIPGGKRFLRWAQASATVDDWTLQLMGC